MGQGSLPNIEFSQTLGYKWPCTQSSLLVVFVCKAKICAQLFDYHAEGLANTASFLPRDPSDSPRRDGAVAAFLQPDRASSSAATIPSGTRRNAGYHPSDLIVLLYAIMAGLRRINKTDVLLIIRNSCKPHRRRSKNSGLDEMNFLNLQVTPPRPFSIFKGSASKNR